MQAIKYEQVEDEIINIRYHKQYGYSGLELMGVLVVFAFIIVSTIKILENFNKNKEFNQLADQAKQFRTGSVLYIGDNYRSLVQQTRHSDKVIPYSEIRRYMPSFVTGTTKYYQIPCLYITSGPVNSIQAYLIFGNKYKPRTINYLDLARVAKNIGANAGILVRNNDKYGIKGGSFSDLDLPAAVINRICQTCGFIDGLSSNSLIMNLTRDRELFLQIKHKIDDDSTNASPDPSLKKTSDKMTTMQTNIYLDSVVTESVDTSKTLHRYMSLDFGNSSFTNGRIRLSSTAPQNDVAVKTSQLNVDNAGLQAGYIAPMSRLIQSGSRCGKNDLGKMAQQQENNILGIGGQLQCTYNPTFCRDDGYCYLPVKTSNVLIHYRQNVQVGTCPSGTRLSDEQPSDSINREYVPCPGSLNGERVGCYRNFIGVTFCSSYQTICSYVDERGVSHRREVPALKKLLCTAATSEYTIDGYRP